MAERKYWNGTRIPLEWAEKNMAKPLPPKPKPKREVKPPPRNRACSSNKPSSFHRVYVCTRCGQEFKNTAPRTAASAWCLDCRLEQSERAYRASFGKADLCQYFNMDTFQRMGYLRRSLAS